ncbi:hypothetical protein V8C86DRAFT_2521906 [Haematococcus lacustris]
MSAACQQMASWAWFAVWWASSAWTCTSRRRCSCSAAAAEPMQTAACSSRPRASASCVSDSDVAAIASVDLLLPDNRFLMSSATAAFSRACCARASRSVACSRSTAAWVAAECCCLAAASAACPASCAVRRCSRARCR